MDDAGIAQVNRALLDHAGPTDVITARYLAVPGEEEGDIAELYINVERAVHLATARWPAGRELALYLAHGCDHLAGEVDDTLPRQTRMRRRELKWLRDAANADLSLSLIKGGKTDGV